MGRWMDVVMVFCLVVRWPATVRMRVCMCVCVCVFVCLLLYQKVEESKGLAVMRWDEMRQEITGSKDDGN